MANQPDHDFAGLLCGGLAALFTSQAESLEDALRETAAGALGGLLGSRVPDILEPPTHPGHRSFFHGVAANGTAAYFGAPRLVRWRLSTTDPAQGEDAATRTASAFAIGAAAGHVSHLALDATTPRGLPWIV